MRIRIGIIRSALALVVTVPVALSPLLATARAAQGPAPAHSASGAVPTGVGYDISYPQCGSALPSDPVFGVVGVNGGLANDANPCFSSELSWALTLPGLTSPAETAASLYIDTADPGPARGVTDWPQSGSGAGYGSCHGGWSKACAFRYGRLRAEYSYALVSTTDLATTDDVRWWLDVETSSSWASRSTRNFAALNLATIRGFISGLRSSGVRPPIGIYSFARQWRQITGLSAQTTAAAFGGSSPPDWVGGHGSYQQAQANCASRGFTGARPVLAQFRSGGFDADLRCG